MRYVNYVILLGLLSVGLFSIPDVFAVELAHSYYERTNFYNATFGDTAFHEVPDINMASGNFTAGEKYLIVVNAQIMGSTSSQEHGIRTTHGGTEFLGSYMVRECGITCWRDYTFMTVWTAVASEDITIEIETHTSSVFMMVDQLSIFAMELDDSILLEGRDWYFEENTNVRTLPVSNLWLTDGAEITFDANGSDDWLFMSTNRIDSASVGWGSLSRLNMDNSTGELPTGDNGMAINNEGEANDAYFMHFLARIYTPTDGEHLIRAENTAENTGGQVEYNNVFGINLNLFETHSGSYLADGGGGGFDDLSLCDATCDVVATTFTPITAGDFFMMGYQIHDRVGNGHAKIRIQTDQVDQPPTFTTDNYRLGVFQDGGDKIQWSAMSVESLNSTQSHALDTDASKSGNRNVMDSSVIAFSMEILPPPLPPSPVTDLTSTAIGTTFVDLDWTEPDLNQGTLIGYQINYTTPQSTTVQTTGTIFLNDTGVIDDTITGLLSGTSYSASVHTWTELGKPTSFGNVYNFTTVFLPEGKYIWFNCSLASNSTQGCIFAMFCPVGEFVNGFWENGTASCATP